MTREGYYEGEEATNERVDFVRNLTSTFQRDIGVGRGDMKRNKRAVKALNFWLNWFGDGKGNRVPSSVFDPSHVELLEELL